MNAMSTGSAALAAVRRRRPEWEPWLAVVEEALRAADGEAWAASVPSRAECRADVPMLAAHSMAIPAGVVRELFERLIGRAERIGTPEMRSLRTLLQADVDLPALVRAAIAQRREPLEEVAIRTGADGQALEAIAGLAVVPLLQACHRRWASSIPLAWIEPYCPVCGAWPAFAEVRGIERNRLSRCGRCGAEWHAEPLKCPYCANADHDELVTLVPEGANAGGVIDACRRCLGYLKALNRLQGCRPAHVMIDDLATVELDLAAVAEGYARPRGAGYAFDRAC